MDGISERVGLKAEIRCHSLVNMNSKYCQLLTQRSSGIRNRINQTPLKSKTKLFRDLTNARHLFF